ncbi:MAG TPA: hypothetical protein VEA63_11895, partial [Opitutus sp.]|nr:hypothetical protein [Opitutus sp.]
MRDIDLREIQWSKLRAYRRSMVIVALVLVAVVAGAVGWKYLNQSAPPWLVRWKLDRYLKQEAHVRDFAVNFPFPSKAEMKAPPEKPAPTLAKGSRTGKDFEALRREYFTMKMAALRSERDGGRRPRSDASSAATGGEGATAGTSRLQDIAAMEAAMAPIVDDLWEFQRQWAPDSTTADGSGGALATARMELARNIDQQIQTAGGYEAMYRAIGRELFVSKRLLESRNPAHRRMGVEIAFAAARHALDHAVNGHVAARICEGYIVPNTDLATDTNPRSRFHEERFLAEAAEFNRANHEFRNVARLYERYLEDAPNPQRADWARSQLAMAYE